ncbi:MAG TPA: cache domain-containing protein, partial [Chloroflexota bacterium]|nr:cache domain-containing protein [Chloroflexota bacterium]
MRSAEPAAPGAPPPSPVAFRPSLRVWLTGLLVGATALAVLTATLLFLPRMERQGMDDSRARVDKGLATVHRQLASDGDRALRLADESELLATRPALVEAFAGRDLPALNELLVQARNQFTGCPGGCTSAIAVVDENRMAVAEQPPRALYDYNRSWVVRNALRANQASPYRPQRGVDARATPANPLADLGLYVAYPIVIDGSPAGAVVILRVYNDALMQELADLTGLDVAVVKSDALIAGSRDVRALFQPPNVRPPAQRLAPVEPVHQIGEQRFVAASEPVRSWT